MILPSGINERCNLDFVSDDFTDGRRFRVLSMIDDYSRQCLAPITDTSLSVGRVVRALNAIIKKRGCKPKKIVPTNGTEFISIAILKWRQKTKRSAGIKSSQAGLNKTTLLIALMVAFETNASMKRCLHH